MSEKYEMILSDSGEQLTSQDIREIEQKLSLVLPDDYKAFMLESNGGMPEGDYVFEFFDEVTEKTNHSVIQEFFILNKEESDDYDDLMTNCMELWDEEMLGKDDIPFALDPGGNYLCLSLGSDDYGTVYLCNHEYDDAETGYLVNSKVADSFSAFIEGLVLDE